MTVKELRDHLDYLMSKYKKCKNMPVEFWVPELDLEDPNDVSAYNHHSTFTLCKEDIYINEWFNGETWDNSNDSYEYVEIKVGN